MVEEMTPEETPVTVRVFWPGETVPALLANQFLVSVGLPGRDGGPDGFYLTIGHVAPPVVHGGTQMRERLAADGIPIEVLGRYFVTRRRMGELIDVLTQVQDAYDKAARQAEGSIDE